MSKYTHLVIEPKMALEAQTNPEARLIGSLNVLRLVDKWRGSAQYPGTLVAPMFMPQTN